MKHLNQDEMFRVVLISDGSFECSNIVHSQISFENSNISNIPPRYGNVTHSRLPWDSVWSPDVILHNPAGSSIILSCVD